jgi:hypothetical protein
MIRKGIRSTKPTVNEIMNEGTEPEPQLDPPRHINNRENYVGVTTIAFEELKGIISTDLPGRFPTTSGQGILMSWSCTITIQTLPMQSQSKIERKSR